MYISKPFIFYEIKLKYYFSKTKPFSDLTTLIVSPSKYFPDSISLAKGFSI